MAFTGILIKKVNLPCSRSKPVYTRGGSPWRIAGFCPICEDSICRRGEETEYGLIFKPAVPMSSGLISLGR